MLGDARCWEMHGAGRCTVLGDARCWEGHGAGRGTVLGGARCWDGHGAGRCTVLGDARCWEGHGAGMGTVLRGSWVSQIKKKVFVSLKINTSSMSKHLTCSMPPRSSFPKNCAVRKPGIFLDWRTS